jgi:predicted LPLAT superfamily acyltransferase
MRVDQCIYETHATKLACRIVLERGKREQQVQIYAQRYADILAAMARRYPYNWFNFFEFWK